MCMIKDVPERSMVLYCNVHVLLKSSCFYFLLSVFPSKVVHLASLDFA